MVSQELDSPTKGQRRKNPTISLPHTPQFAGDGNDVVESSLGVSSSEEAQGLEEVDATPIDR